MVNSHLYPSSPLQLLYTEATKGATKGFVSRTPRLVSHQVFKYIARCEGGSSAVPAGVQSELSPIAAPLCPGPQPAPAAVAGVWEANGSLSAPLLYHPLSISLYTMQQRQGGGICFLYFFQLNFHNLVIRHPTPSHFCGLIISYSNRWQKRFTFSSQPAFAFVFPPLALILSNSKK